MLFFFKQKTAYDMRISDWSSDVCSSDLAEALGDLVEAHVLAPVHARLGGVAVAEGALVDADFQTQGVVDGDDDDQRQIEAVRHFQIADVVQERRVAGGQQYRPLGAVGNRRADGITQKKGTRRAGNRWVSTR